MTEEKLVEQVARAICIIQNGNPDMPAMVGEPWRGPKSAIYIPPDNSWMTPRPLWMYYVPEARAAIKVIAENDPTR